MGAESGAGFVLGALEELACELNIRGGVISGYILLKILHELLSSSSVIPPRKIGKMSFKELVLAMAVSICDFRQIFRTFICKIIGQIRVFNYYSDL